MRTEIKDFITIIRTVIAEDKEIPKISTAYKNLYRLAKSQRMEMIFFCFLKNIGRESEIPKERYNTIIYDYLSKKQEYMKICKKFAQHQIRYMPLKGIRLNKFYPKENMRQMHDIDILVDKKNLEKAKEIFTIEDYTYRHSGHHDKYMNRYGLLFEIHERLGVMRNFDDLFEDPWKYGTNNGLEYTLKPEYEYLYIFAHFSGHITFDGTLFKSLIDLWIYEAKHPGMDFNKINKHLTECNMKEFFDHLKNLKDIWLEKKSINKFYEELTEFLFDTRTVLKNTTINKYDPQEGYCKNLLSLFRNRAFLDDEEMFKRYPWAKHKSLLPMAHMHRWTQGVMKKSYYITTMTKTLTTMHAEEMNQYHDKLKKFGINGQNIG